MHRNPAVRPRESRSLIFLPLAAALLFATPLAAAPQQAESAPEADKPALLEPCGDEMPIEGALCGRYEVFEDRAAKSGRKIELAVLVLPATGAEKATEAVTYFAGGPGGSSIAAAGMFGTFPPELRESRDVMLVDFRGTGDSSPLRCAYQDTRQGFLEGFLPMDGVEACWREVSERANPALYNTSMAVDDVDEVRAALGYRKLDLIGGSYGTRAVIDYLKRHPESARTAVLLGPVPTRTRSPLTFARDAQTALDGWFAECAEDEACAAAFPDLRQEFDRVLATLEKGPVEVEAVTPRAGEKTTLRFSKDAFAQTVRYLLYNTASALQAPLLIHQAAAGNYRPIASAALGFNALVDSGADGFYLSVTCSEDVHQFDLAEGEEASAGTFLGPYRVRQQKEACARWPAPPAPDDYSEPVRTSVPTLIIVGERDPVTPPRWAHELEPYLARHRTIVVPDGGHGLAGIQGVECIQALQTELIVSGELAGLDVEGCLGSLERAEFVLELPDDRIVELEPAALERLVGTYSANDVPLAIEASLQDGKLRLEVPGQPLLTLTPLSEVRFKIEGAPPGFYITFAAGDGPAGSVKLERGSYGPPIEMERKSPQESSP